MENPKVSILIPCYNSEAFLSETLQSCINQSYSNIEIIIVDDGSTDKSLQIANEWKFYHKNIFVYQQKNSGVCKARNLAFEKATGEYIMYLDADDIISHDKLSAQMELLKGKNKNVISTCAWDRFYVSCNDAQFPHLSVYKNYNSGLLLIEDLLNGGMFGISCYLTHRSLIKQAGLWNEQLIINTDGEFFCRVLANAEEVIFCPHGALYYRSSDEDSISRCKANEKKGFSLLQSYVSVEAYLSKKGMLTPRIRNGLIRGYQSVAYQYSEYKKIVNAAQMCAMNINLNKEKVEPSDGGDIFKCLCRIFGFWNILNLKKILR